MSLVMERAETDISDKEVFHYKVLKLIKLFYMVLISGLVIFMGFHQWLDFFKTKRTQKKARKVST